MAFAVKARSPSRASSSTPLAAVRASVHLTSKAEVAAALASANTKKSANKYMAAEKKLTVSEQKIESMKPKNLLCALPTVDAFSWNSSSRGVVSDAHTANARQEQAVVAAAAAATGPQSATSAAAACAAPSPMRSVVNKLDPPSVLGPASKMEQLNASFGTSFGNRMRCSPENPSKPGDGAHHMSKVKVFVSKGSQDSTVHDLIFSGEGQAPEDSAAGKAAKAMLAGQATLRL